ncbi:MAG: hypothetical protein AB7F99_12475 [Vicinamibacterales bacterium]
MKKARAENLSVFGQKSAAIAASSAFTLEAVVELHSHGTARATSLHGHPFGESEVEDE